MVRSQFHDVKLVKEILYRVYKSHPKKFKFALRQLKDLQIENVAQLTISQKHSGYASVPLLEKYSKRTKGDDFYGITQCYIENYMGIRKEFKAYFSSGILIGFAIKEDLENLDLETLDFSRITFIEPTRNSYFVRQIDLEGCFDDCLDILEYVDAVYESEEYLISGQTMFRVIAFDDSKCICIDAHDQVYKVKFAGPQVERLFMNLEDFHNKLRSEENYVFRLFGEV